MVEVNRALETRCTRMLFERARGAGSRQQLRAAARAFVRRHRRDRAYLSWVLRSVGASSALAVALLGVAMPARAELPPFAAQTGEANPLDAQTVTVLSTPSFGDLDGDGDLDLVSGSANGSFSYFENTGTATSPAFASRTGSANPLDGMAVGSEVQSAPALGDLDGDGDLDLVAGDYSSHLLDYFENTGTATGPAFIERTGSANPLSDDPAPFARLRPSFGDLDGDGDGDLVVASGDEFLYAENTGSATNAAFILHTGAPNPLAGHEVGIRATASLGDLDGDGDLDLVAGEIDGVFSCFENTGSAVSAVFVHRTGAGCPLHLQDVGTESSPSLADLDGDGDVDLVSGERLSGRFFYYENSIGNFVPRTGAANPLDGQGVGGATDRSTPAVGDLDADGDLDLIAGELDGTLNYFENTGSGPSPAFVARTGAANPLNGQDVGSTSIASLGDLDGDEDLDLVVVAGNSSTPGYFENTGTPLSAAFIKRTGTANPLPLIAGGLRPAPSLGDLDGDDDLDLVGGDLDGSFHYLENTGTATNPGFIVRTGAANPLDGQSVEGNYSAPSLSDLDGDGDLDVFAGDTIGLLHYFENTGTAAGAAFVARTGAANPLDGQGVGRDSAPSLGDLDGDGDPDLVAGGVDGLFHYFENFVLQPLPAFERTGVSNPLDGKDVGFGSAPALGDLDRDGDLDLVAGERYGTFLYFEDTGSAIDPQFAPRTRRRQSARQPRRRIPLRARRSAISTPMAISTCSAVTTWGTSTTSRTPATRLRRSSSRCRS